MHILIAPNAFKNSLDAAKAAEAISNGLLKSKLNCTTTCFPVADGGDGTGKLLGSYLQAQEIAANVHDPLGRPIVATYGWEQENRMAVIELANASGLRLLKPSEYDPLHATTFGTGELIREAIAKNAATIILCIGGSATVDGGAGIMEALGVKFLDAKGKMITGIPAALRSLTEIIIPKNPGQSENREIIVLCDVENRLLGNQGAAAVFGPQKGAKDADIPLLETSLETFRDVILNSTGLDMAALKHGGAAGGVAAGMHVLLSAKLVNGIDYFLDITHFDRELEKADLVITGEGSIDVQTLQGKGPFGVAKKAKQYALPLIGMAGRVIEDPGLHAYFEKLITITPPDMDLETALANTYPNLERAARQLGDQLSVKAG